jgi:hypothetical protein
MRGTGDDSRSRRLRALALVIAAVLAAAMLAACGSDDEPSGNATASEGNAKKEKPPEEKGPVYKVKLTYSEFFPVAQEVGETNLMRLGFENYGDKVVPNLAVTLGIGGEEGKASSLPFAIHDPTPGVAQADRPVWVMAAGYPKFEGSEQPAGAETANKKTFAFGRLKPGQEKKMVWKLTAVRPGHFQLRYEAAGDLDPDSETRSPFDGVPPGLYFNTDIVRDLKNTKVTDSGRVVEIKE